MFERTRRNKGDVMSVLWSKMGKKEEVPSKNVTFSFFYNGDNHGDHDDARSNC